jgi:hypothetical protein
MASARGLSPFEVDHELIHIFVGLSVESVLIAWFDAD